MCGQRRLGPSLIRVFPVRLKKARILSYPLSAQLRLIRLCECPGWSESLLGAHAILLVLSWFGSYTATFLVSMHAYINIYYNNTRATAWQNQQNDMGAQRRLRSAWVSTQSDQSLLCSLWQAKNSRLPHSDSEDWSDWVGPQADLSLHLGHDILLVLSCCGTKYTHRNRLMFQCQYLHAKSQHLSWISLVRLHFTRWSLPLSPPPSHSSSWTDSTLKLNVSNI